MKESEERRCPVCGNRVAIYQHQNSVGARRASLCCDISIETLELAETIADLSPEYQEDLFREWSDNLIQNRIKNDCVEAEEWERANIAHNARNAAQWDETVLPIDLRKREEADG